MSEPNDRDWDIARTGGLVERATVVAAYRAELEAKHAAEMNWLKENRDLHMERADEWRARAEKAEADLVELRATHERVVGQLRQTIGRLSDLSVGGDE